MTQFEVHGTSLTTPYEIAYVFSKHSESSHSINFCSGKFLKSYFKIQNSAVYIAAKITSLSSNTLQGT